jgi:acyl-ACP thioesterase
MSQITPAVFTMPYKIASYDADRSRQLRQSAQLRIQQEIGELHLKAAGCSYTRLFDEYGFFFALTRSTTVICRAPAFGEDVEVRTWSAGVRGVQFIRGYEFIGNGGEILLQSAGAFAALDVKSHRLMRPDAVLPMINLETFERETLCGDPGKIKALENMEIVGNYKVRYSDTDYNGHLNNTVYADFIVDYMPGGAAGRILTGYSLQFRAEAVEGDELTFRGAVQDGVFYLEGAHERGICFSASAAFEAE